ncbi:hypothetical protein DNH61_11990 [Paenibacillus sambharensis]|uniref:Uncharacterized protein n=1 Tax=Paenibacillus sambharensis TaxID=1803190 RepID=A0A2W1LAV5_9BACL|nr:hypothetical protein [Paenibacillus sambharensis]PZD95270.1 hypothetical protein DNH61_11990 [Paenibacillus sambharensis]
MSFVVMFVAAWLSSFILYSMNKSLSVAENVFVYLIILAIGLNISWFVAEEFKLVDITRNGLSYTGFLIYRTVTFPILYVIMLNAAFKSGKTAGALLSACAVVAVILSLNGLMLFYEAFIYKKWNLFYDAVIIILLQAVSYGLLKLYRKAMYRGGDVR